MLSDSEPESTDSDDLHQFTINDHYAKAYQHRKEREELQKLKDKYGSDFEEEGPTDESTDSESAESEDEDGEELTPAVDAAILRTLARIKNKDPTIYNSEKQIFGEEQSKITSIVQNNKTRNKQSKPITFRQVVLDAALHTGSRSPSPELRKPTHVEQQKALRDETIAAFHHALTDASEDSDDSGGGVLIPREKTKDELEKEEEDYRAFLENELGSDLEDLITVETFEPDAAELQTRNSRNPEADGSTRGKSQQHKSRGPKKSTKEQEDQEFLMNYILNRGWVDKSSKRVPTYKEITSSKKSKAESATMSASEALDASQLDDGAGETGFDSDTSFESLNDAFESSYNFRFEEPGGSTIQTFPRNLPDTVRREPSTRKDARARRQERKRAELEQKREEIRRLKGLKMKEVRKKLERIEREAGRGKKIDEDEALQQLDLEGDWDPETHDRQMARLYDDDNGTLPDGEKPTWDEDIDIDDIYVSGDKISIPTVNKKEVGKKKKKKKNEKEEDQVDGVDIDEMDADVVRDDEEWDGTEEMRKRKMKEYMDEIYALDFNDIVGGLPTRFKYIPVKPESFALSPVEILMATDEELNQYMGIKKYAPYRQGGTWDKHRNDKLRELKQILAARSGNPDLAGAWSNTSGDRAGARDDTTKPVKRRKGKKERMRAKAAGGGGGVDVENDGLNDDEFYVQGKESSHSKRSQKRKREKAKNEDGDGDNLDSSSRKRRHKHKSKA
ncbi:hypothetical protein AMATHDRAFT_74825 [Amanita thiersii Skay4041]|uniref:Kri1-like C-terminal domain-containing protein n=1 Tax=Amanita thiersii Skay4041 TaxID=703135 RepID=A0A2A9NM76_9AGAR|nr:hypothetical protein AMATHDRAFT_74825 [Amanita thiersii Skay4041]